MNDVTKGLLEALKAAQAYVCGPTAWTQEQEDTLVEAMSKAIARAESALSAPQSDALEQVRAEEREACAKVCERERDALNENLQVWQENPMLTPCDEFIADWDSEAKTGEQYAAAIRARGQK